jgi:hypothetical protein
LQTIWNYYGDSVDGYIIAGDIVDGPDTKGAIDVATKYMGAVLVRGNHEGHLLTAMCEQDESNRFMVASFLWPRVHDRVLESYGIYPNQPSPGNALKLRDKMPDEHLRFLNNSELYVEKNDFVVVHANVSSDSWPMQKKYLDTIKAYNKEGLYVIEGELGLPYQLGEGATQVNEYSLTQSGLTKTLLSGHFHVSSRNIEDRTLNNGQHVLLATPKRANYSVVFESWTQQARVIQAT